MSDLRDRIAAAIYDHPNPLSLEQCEEVADAVIAELGLEVDLTYLSDDKTRRYFELRGFYQTEWGADDE